MPIGDKQKSPCSGFNAISPLCQTTDDFSRIQLEKSKTLRLRSTPEQEVLGLPQKMKVKEKE